MKGVVLVLLCCFANVFGAIEVQKCANGKKIEDYKLKVRVEDCKTPPCKLKKGKSVLIEFRFTTDRAVNSIKNDASAVLASVPLPFLGVDGTPACENMFESDGNTKASCSLEAGKEYVYRNVINVLELYPTTKLTVHWGLLGDDGDHIMCFEVPASIVN